MLVNLFHCKSVNINLWIVVVENTLYEFIALIPYILKMLNNIPTFFCFVKKLESAFIVSAFTEGCSCYCYSHGRVSKSQVQNLICRYFCLGKRTLQQSVTVNWSIFVMICQRLSTFFPQVTGNKVSKFSFTFL